MDAGAGVGWKANRDELIANFKALINEFEKHLEKAGVDGSKDRERIARTEIVRAHFNACAFELLQRIDTGEMQRDELTEWELSAIDALDR